METKFDLIPTFDNALNCNVLVRRTLSFEGEIMKQENWRCVLEKGAKLNVLDTVFGSVNFDDFPAERDYILAKWAELEA